ncbi:MAG: hypothetical protein PHH26_08985, partial [Candidatus Thermoplasmatota archaeon]|nr:hypothetical protein [Candidatus Thermoplasmatota archaeon]
MKVMQYYTIMACLSLIVMCVPYETSAISVEHCDGNAIVETLFLSGLIEIYNNIQFNAENIFIIEGCEIISKNPSLTITITAAESISVSGKMISGNGFDANSLLWKESSPQMDGVNGGSILLSAGNSIIIEHSGSICSGSGGNGRESFVSVDCQGNKIISRGGNGGAGGNVILESPAISILGKIIIGSGGHGGNATAIANVVDGDGNGMGSLSIGGNGGNSGNLIVRGKLLRQDIHSVEGGVGGNGGGARAIGCSASTSCQSDEDGSEGGNSGDWGASDGKNGNGEDGNSSYVVGENSTNGGDVGKYGGNATARGTDGSNGHMPGTNGGDGGNATAIGGRGGNGVKDGGHGGDAYAYGGKGGDGTDNPYGKGGDGGWGGYSTALGGRGGDKTWKLEDNLLLMYGGGGTGGFAGAYSGNSGNGGNGDPWGGGGPVIGGNATGGEAGAVIGDWGNGGAGGSASVVGGSGGDDGDTIEIQKTPPANWQIVNDPYVGP